MSMYVYIFRFYAYVDAKRGSPAQLVAMWTRGAAHRAAADQALADAAIFNAPSSEEAPY